MLDHCLLSHPQSLTLTTRCPDFGDYSDAYYSVQTTEGEPISQLIAGYIDIIMRKRQALDYIGIEGDDGSAMLEDNVAPTKSVECAVPCWRIAVPPPSQWMCNAMLEDSATPTKSVECAVWCVQYHAGG